MLQELRPLRKLATPAARRAERSPSYQIDVADVGTPAFTLEAVGQDIRDLNERHPLYRDVLRPLAESVRRQISHRGRVGLVLLAMARAEAAAALYRAGMIGVVPSQSLRRSDVSECLKLSMPWLTLGAPRSSAEDRHK